MTFKIINNQEFMIILNNDYLNHIDIYDKAVIEQLIRKLFSKIIKRYELELSNLLKFIVYVDNYYGIIIKVINEGNNIIYNNRIDVKILFNVNSVFLYKLSDYYQIIDNDLANYPVYYYHNNYYLKLNDKIETKKMMLLLEFSDIIFGEETENVIQEGIKVGV